VDVRPSLMPGEHLPEFFARLRRGLVVIGAMLGVVLVLAAAVLVLVLRSPGLFAPGHADAKATNGGKKANESGAPSTPEKGKAPAPLGDQKRPPCEAKFQVEMNGGCWQQISGRPCPSDGFVTNGKCYAPVRPSEPLPGKDPFADP
jgi:hypothetical protein